MASGGVTKKGAPSNGNYRHRQNPQDQQWTALPNNLDLSGSSRSSKKQRNKEDYSTENSPQYNIMPSNNPNHISASLPSNKTSRQNEQFLGDAETGYQNVYRHHGEQTSHYQSQHGIDGKGHKMTENSGRKLYKENNIQKIPDTNAIVERLGHLRDYMKDVTSVMGSLEKSDDPDAREQKKKLGHMLRQLQQEEQQYFNLLQQMLSSNDEQLPNVADDGNATSTSLEPNDKGNNEDIEETLEHGEKLLKKMMESQEKMESLKKQEADLLAMQKEAESKLAEAKAFHSTLMKKEQAMRNEKERYIQSLEWNYKSQDNPSYNAGEVISNDMQSREKCPIGVSINLDRLNEGDHSHGTQANSDELMPTGFEAAYENLRHRLQHLKDISNNNPPEQQEEQHAMDSGESGDSKMEWHRKKLENKLKELQEKKRHMDTMLVELSALEQASGEIKNGHSNQLKTADSSIEEAQHLLDTIDAREKMKKLEEMKESLKQLRSLVNSIQPPPTAELLPPTNEDRIETISNSSRSSSQVPPHRAETPRSLQYQQPSSQPKRDNIRRDKSNKFPVRRHYEAEGRANEDGDNSLPSSSARTSISNVDNSWETDPQIQEKVRKLQDAKEKLQRLQGLMCAIENSKGTDYPTTLEYLQFLSSISDEDKQEEEGQQENHLNTNESKNSHEGEAVSHLQDLDRLDAVEECMQEQERELEKLMKERLQLLTMQNQLTKIQQQFKNAHSASEERLRLQQQKPLNQSRSNSNSSSSRGLSPCHQSRAENCLSGRQNLPYDSSSHINPNVNSRTEGRMSVTKKDNINSMSANLSGRVKHGKDAQTVKDSGTNAASDSLLMKGNDLDESVTFHELKRNLYDDILRRQFSKQYSHNEDVRSQSCSSANSEFQEGSNSILAADTTAAATWGGSSTQNDLEDEHVESLEEQEGSEVEVQHDTNIWQAQHSVSPSQQTFRKERMHNKQDTESQIRRDNRLGSHNFKGDHVNRWNTRKNYHQKQQRNQFASIPNQETHGNLCAASRLNTEEAVQPQNLVTTDSTANPTVWQQFTHHIHQQLEHMNTLCQSIFHDQQALTSCFLSSSLSPPLVGRSSRPGLSDSWLQNTYQFQQQQQLLLSLSQCYHMIHLQQLEIQYLHQCLQQQPDAEHTVVQTPVINQEHVPEEFTFRPWITAPSANTQDSFSSVQNASVSVPTFVQSNSSNNSFNIPAQTSNCNFAGQNAVTATLNNQVPPRTRANNFWDNFRSYSRQNMLSTSKSNEALSTNISSPQLQSLPADNVTSSCSYRPQLRSQPCVENVAQTNCLKGRRVPNTKLQEIMIKSKKPNSCKDGRQAAGYSNKAASTQQTMPKPKLSAKDIHARENAPIVEPCLQNASTSTESSYCFLSPSDRRSGDLEQRVSGNNNAVQEFVYNEVSKIISRAEGKPDLMQDLLQDFLRKFKDSQQANAILNCSGATEQQTSTPRNESSQLSNIGPSTGAVRKRTSNKRPKAEQPSVPVLNTAGAGSAPCTENVNERIGKTEKDDPSHMVAEQDVLVPVQEERIAGGLDSASAGNQIAVSRSAQIAEEDMVYECDPEGETEPDVEAETDDTKDLAEADQSPGQRDHSQHFRQTESLPLVGAVGASYSGSATSRTETTSTIVTSPDPLRFFNCSEEEPDITAAMGDAMHAQPTVDELPTTDEVTLDDIPTKLTPLSEEEVQRQMPEEVLLYEAVSEEASDAAKEQGPF